MSSISKYSESDTKEKRKQRKRKTPERGQSRNEGLIDNQRLHLLARERIDNGPGSFRTGARFLFYTSRLRQRFPSGKRMRWNNASAARANVPPLIAI